MSERKQLESNDVTIWDGSPPTQAVRIMTTRSELKRLICTAMHDYANALEDDERLALHTDQDILQNNILNKLGLDF